MENITLCGKTIKVNQREAKLVRIIRMEADRLLEYYHSGRFDTSTYRRIVTEIDGLVTAMYFMDLFEEPMSAYDVEEIRADEEFLKLMLGAEWYKIYE